MKPTTQTEDILNYLLLGLPLTPLEAVRKFSCLKLASRCSEYIRDGYPIEKTPVMVKTRYGSVRIMKYQIKQS